MSSRVKHVLFAANVVALVAVATVYLLSYAVGYTLFVYDSGRCWMVDTLRGEISVWTGPVATKKDAVQQRTYDPRAGFTVEQIFAQYGDWRDDLPRTLGFGYGKTNILFSGPAVAPGGVVYLLVTPYWFILMLLGIWPVRRVVRFANRKRIRVDRRAFPVFVAQQSDSDRVTT
jgi:hypothetical protein